MVMATPIWREHAVPTLRFRVLAALMGNGALTAEEVCKIVREDGPAELRHVRGYLGDEGHRRRVNASVRDDGEIVYILASGIANLLRWEIAR